MKGNICLDCDGDLKHQYVMRIDQTAGVAKGTVTQRRIPPRPLQVRVEVDGIGAVTALGPVGGRWATGDVELGVEPDALAAPPL